MAQLATDSLDTAKTEVGAGGNGDEQDEQDAKYVSKNKDDKKVDSRR
jgi:hypothetical protein